MSKASYLTKRPLRRHYHERFSDSLAHPYRLDTQLPLDSDLPYPPSIRLLTCYGACGPAQELSTSLGIPVRAATKPVGMMQVPGSKLVVRDGRRVARFYAGGEASVKVVGLFRELDREMSPSLESIHDLRGRLSPDAASLVTEYLQRGTPIFDVMGVSEDPLDERFIFSGGPSLVSDGLWVWRSDLHYFVDKYNMQLPEEFIRHVIAAGGTPVDMSGEIARIGEDVITAYDRAAKGL